MNGYYFDNNFPRNRGRSSIITFRYNLQRNISNTYIANYIMLATTPAE